jgi:uncharacterized damage-inducible protein DinB
MDEKVVREQLVALLTEEHAHVNVSKAIAGLDPKLRGVRPKPNLKSVFEELEHIRLAQEDILRYTLEPGWVSPKWPEGYWPPRAETVGDAEWQSSVSRFEADLAAVCGLARDSKFDLTAKIPHGESRTYLRQILLVADHNAYHAGQIVQVRKALGAWGGEGAETS